MLNKASGDLGPIVVPAVEFGSVLVLRGRCLPFPGEAFLTISLSGITLKGVWLPVEQPRPQTGFTPALISDAVLGCWRGVGSAPFPWTSSDNPDFRLLKWLLQPIRFASPLFFFKRSERTCIGLLRCVVLLACRLVTVEGGGGRRHEAVTYLPFAPFFLGLSSDVLQPVGTAEPP